MAETLPRKTSGTAPATTHPAKGKAEGEFPGYEVLGELGRGAMGIVYKAKQLALGRIVALKVIRASDATSADEIARFKSEAAAIARLQHPNIVQIYEFSEQGEWPYFSLEFIDGGTLSQKIAGVQQSPREAAQLIETLARAVHQAHLAGIVHRDLKPANVLLTRDGVPKITDFGLAKQAQADYAATETGMLMGTPLYMAPEQAAADSARIGVSADLWAIGAMLYELLTGRPPFQKASLSDLLNAIRALEPVAPRIFNRELPRDQMSAKISHRTLRLCSGFSRRSAAFSGRSTDSRSAGQFRRTSMALVPAKSWDCNAHWRDSTRVGGGDDRVTLRCQLLQVDL